MAYNKAREERKWRLWKEAEEKQLRQLGVCEKAIEQLREHDSFPMTSAISTAQPS